MLPAQNFFETMSEKRSPNRYTYVERKEVTPMLAVWLSLVEGERDKELFLEFHRRYEKKLYAVALNILKNPALAEETVNETFLRVATHFEKFVEIYDRDRREIGPWAVTIVKNISLDILEKENRTVALSEDWDAPASEDTESRDGYKRLVELIRSMPQGYRRALELKFVLEYSGREVAKALGISEEAAQKRIERGRALLIEKLKEEGYTYE